MPNPNTVCISEARLKKEGVPHTLHLDSKTLADKCIIHYLQVRTFSNECFAQAYKTNLRRQCTLRDAHITGNRP